MNFNCMCSVKYNPTVRELAEEIWGLSAEQQAHLLDMLFEVADNRINLEKQIIYMAEELYENGNGRGADVVDMLNEAVKNIKNYYYEGEM